MIIKKNNGKLIKSSKKEINLFMGQQKFTIQRHQTQIYKIVLWSKHKENCNIVNRKFSDNKRQ